MLGENHNNKRVWSDQLVELMWVVRVAARVDLFSYLLTTRASVQTVPIAATWY